MNSTNKKSYSFFFSVYLCLIWILKVDCLGINLDCTTAVTANDCFLQDQTTGLFTGYQFFGSGCGWCSTKQSDGTIVGTCAPKHESTGLPANQSLHCEQGWAPDICSFYDSSFTASGCWYLDGMLTAIGHQEIGSPPPFGCGWCVQSDHPEKGFCTGKKGDKTRIENICKEEFHVAISCPLVSKCWGCIAGRNSAQTYLETRNYTLDPSYYDYLFTDYECEWCDATQTCSNIRDNVPCPITTGKVTSDCCNSRVHHCGHCHQQKSYGICDWCEADQTCVQAAAPQQCSNSELGYTDHQYCESKFCAIRTDCIACSGESYCMWCGELGEYGQCVSTNSTTKNCIQGGTFTSNFQICSDAYFDDGTCGDVIEICAVCNISVCRATELRLQKNQSLTINAGVTVSTEEVIIPFQSTLVFDLVVFNFSNLQEEEKEGVIVAHKCVNVTGTLQLDLGELPSGQNKINLIDSDCVDIDQDTSIQIKEPKDKKLCEFWEIESSLGAKGLSVLIAVDKTRCESVLETVTKSDIFTRSAGNLDQGSLSWVETFSRSFVDTTRKVYLVEDSETESLGIPVIWIAIASAGFVILVLSVIFGVVTYKKNKRHRQKMAAAKARMERMNARTKQVQKETSKSQLLS